MNDGNNEMKALADNLWTYFEPKIKAMMASNVSYFRAQVTATEANGKITIQRPFDDTEMALPFVPSLGGSDSSGNPVLQVGDQVTVLSMGSLSNSIIIGTGTLSNL